jgi:DNA primase
MAIDLEVIRSRNPIEDVVSEKFTLKRTGKRFIGIEHDSLVVIPNTGFYFWNSRGEQGDMFDFVGRHVLGSGNWNNRNADQFMESVKWLAQRANIPLENPSDFHRSPIWIERQLVQRLHDCLLNTPAALEYVTQQRGWQLSTVKAARIGYMPQDKRPLLSELNLSEHWHAVIQRFPPGMIVYV